MDISCFWSIVDKETTFENTLRFLLNYSKTLHCEWSKIFSYGGGDGNYRSSLFSYLAHPEQIWFPVNLFALVSITLGGKLDHSKLSVSKRKRKKDLIKKVGSTMYMFVRLC